VLPHKKSWLTFFIGLALTFSTSFASVPASAGTSGVPPVFLNEIKVSPEAGLKAFNGSSSEFIFKVEDISTFTLVGLTWQGQISSETKFKVRVKESGNWSTWFDFAKADYHEPDISDGADARFGTDPLLTGLADGVELKISGKLEGLPKDLRMALINSEVTSQDKAIAIESKSQFSKNGTKSMFGSSALPPGSVTTPSGTVVAKPKIVTRAEWGANEAWRDRVPKMGKTIKAGIVHHTASTNNYTAEQSPAQMRILYSYFTKTLKYADMGYNFLVDKYGTIYEGRNGCVYKTTKACDGTALPAQGAHTAGFNVDTFSISAIGNYDVLAPANPAAMVDSISALMAWKLAPYGLDPNANTKIVSTDTSGSSKYRKGQEATLKVVSAHRDVGKTACPGRYFYPYMDEIRDRTAAILQPVIGNVQVAPNIVAPEQTDQIAITATVPTIATWSITVKDEKTGKVVRKISGKPIVATPSPTPTPTASPTPTPTRSATPTPTPSPKPKLTTDISFLWDRENAEGAAVGLGRYTVTITAKVGTKSLVAKKSTVVIGTVPSTVTKFKFSKRSSTKATITWENRSNYLPLTVQSYRFSTDAGKTWGDWKQTKEVASSVRLKDLKLGKSYAIQVRTTNALGTSKVKTFKFKHKL
jgi:hypothetical protein